MEAITNATHKGGFVITRSEITDRKRLEREQRDREEQLRF